MRSSLVATLALVVTTACGPSYLGPIEVVISPEAPQTADTIQVVARVPGVVESFEIGASNGTDSLTFTGDDLESESDGFARVYRLAFPPENTTKGQEWTFSAIGREGRGEYLGNATITIANTPPVAQVTVGPELPTRGTVLTANATAEDPDGDTVELSYRWRINNDDTEITGPEFPALTARRNDVVSVIVTPTDGETEGAEVSASVTLRNTPPVVEVTLDPAVADTTATLVALASGSDADGDDLVYEFSWEVNGEQLSFTTPELGPQFTTRDDVVRVRAVARDGRSLSEPAFAEATITNSPPTTPEVQIPSGDGVVSLYTDLLCDLVVESTDADRDPLTYTFTWWRGGVEYTGPTTTTHFPGDTIAYTETEDGDLWACSAVATDGTATSDSAMSDEVEIVPVLSYKIPFAQLVNQGSDCSSSGKHEYNGCSGNYGFYWNDANSVRPRSITVEYNHGLNCGTGTRTAFLNGTSIGTAATGDVSNCDCNVSAGTWVKKYDYTSMASYRPGARNDFTMSATSCEGFSAKPEWADAGKDIYAIVTVSY